MKKVYFLQTCDTCRRILREISLTDFEKQEIKSNPISVSQLEETSFKIYTLKYL